MKKLKVLTLSDHPLSPSGVGTQTRYICEALLNSGKFEIISLGGAMKHHNYDPVSVEPYGNEWRIIPVDGYGKQEMIRSIVRNERPDFVWIMTDPRFWDWLWAIENEIRPLCPIVYYHVWDNYPYPHFNKKFYESNDRIACISKVSHDIVRTVAPDVSSEYIPHAVDSNYFQPLDIKDRQELRKANLHPDDVDKFIIFWNNRNARRKQSGTLIWWFKEWLDQNNLHDKVQLIMHTDPKDPHGQDLNHIMDRVGIGEHREVLLSTQKVPLDKMSTFYNLADVTINISDAEGFGLSTLESLACGTPIIVNKTGGLQEQVERGKNKFGIGIEPTSKAVIGSQQVPYIYEDRISQKDFNRALSKMYRMPAAKRREMGMNGHKHVMKNYNFEKFQETWVNYMLKIHEEEGSWETRVGYSNITFKEVA
jgi:glycosyltransferase involved in cell wall biosynthesis